MHKPVIQLHHLSYEPEIVVKLYRGEHWIITQLNRREKVSKGFIICLKEWLKENESKAVEI